MLLSVVIPECSIIGQDLSLNANKSKRYYDMKMADDKRDGLEPYIVIQLDEYLNKNPSVKNQLLKIDDYIESNDSLINLILSDSIFSKVRSLSGKCYGLETKPKYYYEYANFKDRLNTLESNTHQFISQDKDLINIDYYTIDDEYLFLRTSFYFQGAFEPKNVDDCRLLYNLTQQCVLCFRDIKITNCLQSKYIGIFQSKYLLSITVPIIYENKYLCDIRLVYLK